MLHALKPIKLRILIFGHRLAEHLPLCLIHPLKSGFVQIGQLDQRTVSLSEIL